MTTTTTPHVIAFKLQADSDDWLMTEFLWRSQAEYCRLRGLVQCEGPAHRRQSGRFVEYRLPAFKTGS